MSSLTAPEIQLLQTRPHKTKLWLSIYQPTTILSCLVNDVGIGRKERAITYDNGDGAFANVKSGMVMYVKDSTGSIDKGRIRVKSATASVITVAENSHINWANNDQLTIVNFFEITSIYPRIIHDPADEEDVIFYKDYDLAYTNQNSNLGSLICMGPHRATFLGGVSGTANIYYDASDTSHVAGGAVTYNWTFEGADTPSSAVVTPGYIPYSTPGHYTTTLAVTKSGVTEYSYRHISIYDRPENGVNVPILEWELETLTGTRNDGGYKGGIKVRTPVDEDVIRDGMLVIIFADDWYGYTQQSVGGNAPNTGSIVFVGYIQNGSIEYDYQDGFVVFDVVSPCHVMKENVGFAVSVESKTNPSTWFELKDMNCKKAIYHYLRWHSTALLCNDFEFVGTDLDIQYFDSDRESIYDAINKLMDGTLAGSVVADRQGKVWAELDAKAINNATGEITHSDFRLNKYAWMGSPILEENQLPRVSYLEMGGIAYDGPATGDFAAYMAAAPGDAPGYGGSVVRKQGLALASQAQLNTLIGNIYAWENARYGHFSVRLSGNFRNYDIAPQEIVEVNLDDTDTPRRIVFSNKDFLPTGMSFAYLPGQQMLFSTLVLHEITQGMDGETILIPEVPPDDGYYIPPFDLPPIGGLQPPYFPLGGFPAFGGPFALYDEGVLLGTITSLDVIGSYAQASIPTPGYGRLTFGYSGASGSVGICTDFDCSALNLTPENTIMGIGSVREHGMEHDDGEESIIFLVSGMYEISVFARFQWIPPEDAYGTITVYFETGSLVANCWGSYEDMYGYDTYATNSGMFFINAGTTLKTYAKTSVEVTDCDANAHLTIYKV